MNPAGKRFAAGMLLIFAVYFYFLIFAQFAFLELVRAIDSSDSHLHRVMGAMAVGGLAGSFILPLFGPGKIRTLLRLALLGSAVVAITASKLRIHFELLALLIGLFVGIETVGVATFLRSLFTIQNWPWGVALGTGMAYFACNLPLVFQSSARWQALAAAVVTLLASCFVPSATGSSAGDSEQHLKRVSHHGRRRSMELLHYILFFGILVWFDSAIFYIIQHTAIKEQTWGGGSALWRNAFVHLFAALSVGAFVRKAGFSVPLFLSFALLAIGSLAANDPALRFVTGWSYPAGVSVYSACLVAFPAFGPIAGHRSQIAWVAAALYALSGWIGSGLGIGMAQNLHQVPLGFIVVSAGVLAAPFFWKAAARLSKREIAYTAGVLACAAVANAALTPAKGTAASRVEQGRAVYISEGCINCHSQFVRPGRADELLWGPHRPIGPLSTNVPPLFGNRRQGPDLLNIGNRRSRAWLELHFKVPRELAPGSSMPSYEHLFSDGRGSALVDYLLSLNGPEPRAIAAWRPDFATEVTGDGRALYQEHCAVCHGHSESVRQALPIHFRQAPPDLFSSNLRYAPDGLPPAIRVEQIARIIKFGITGTDMAGHEYMADQDVIALARYLEQESAIK